MREISSTGVRTGSFRQNYFYKNVKKRQSDVVHGKNVLFMDIRLSFFRGCGLIEQEGGENDGKGTKSGMDFTLDSW